MPRLAEDLRSSARGRVESESIRTDRRSRQEQGGAMSCRQRFRLEGHSDSVIQARREPANKRAPCGSVGFVAWCGRSRFDDDLEAL